MTPEKITQKLEESPTKSLDVEIVTLETAGSLPRKLQETPKSLPKPCIRCKTSEATCDFLVSYQPFFDKYFESPLKTTYPNLICQNCEEYFQVCVKNSALKSDLETEKSRSDKLFALKDLKVNSFSINVRNLDQKNLSNYDRIRFEKYLKANSEKPPKSYCEMSDENTQLKAEIEKLNDEHDIELNRVKEKIRLLQSEKSEHPSKEILVENKKLRKSIDKLEEEQGEHDSEVDRLKEKIKTLQSQNSTLQSQNSKLIAENYSSPKAEKKVETSDESMKLKEEIKIKAKEIEKLKNEKDEKNLDVNKLKEEMTKLQNRNLSVEESKNAKSSQLEDELEKNKKDKEQNEMKLDAYFRQNNEYREKIKKIEESEHERIKEIEEKIRREFSQKIQGNLLKGIDKKTVRREDIEPIKKISYVLFSVTYFL